jgi:hypothetical protein
MEQSPSGEANNQTATQDIPCLLHNPNVDYHVSNSLPLTSALSQKSSVHILMSYYYSFKIHLYPAIYPTAIPLKINSEGRKDDSLLGYSAE